MQNPKKISAKKLKEMLSEISELEKVAFSDMYIRGDSAGNFVVVNSEDVFIGYIHVGDERYESFRIMEGEDAGTNV